MKTTLDSVKADTSSILRLSEEHREELRKTRQVLLKAVFEATEVSTPTCFVVLNEELPELTADEKSWIEENVAIKDDGTGVEIKGKPPQWFLKLEARFKDGLTEGLAWADQLAGFKPKKTLTSKNFFNCIKEPFKKLLEKKKLYFYLVDELTGEPVRGGDYPIVLTERSELVSKLVPVMQVGLHAMSVYNGVAGIARMFVPALPTVPEKWREGAQSSVELLKQKSSVEKFGAIHEKVEAKDETNETVRGASLRELEAFFAEKDASKGYAGLRRIGDPSDGTAIWTVVADENVEAKLAERGEQRRSEERRHDEYMEDLMAKAAGDDRADAGAGRSASADAGSDADDADDADAAATAMTATTPAAGGGPAAARALSTLEEPTATLALRDPPGAADGLRTWAADVEERIARLERRSVETRLDRLEASVRADPSARAGVEERLAGLEARLAGTDWAY